MSLNVAKPVSSRKRRNIILSIIVVAAVIIVGVVLQVSRGAGFAVFLNPGSATVTGNAALVNDSGSTDGKVLRFGDTPPTTPPPTTPPPTTPPPTTPPPTGQIPANTIPTGGDVGFRGDESKLITANASNVPIGMRYNSAGGWLELSSAVSRTFEGYKFTVPVDLSTTMPANGVTLTFKNNVFAVAGNQSRGGLTYQGAFGTSQIIIQDNTFKAGTPLAANFGNGNVQIDSRCTIQRNDISGRADGIQNGNGQCLIEQNHIHSPGNWGSPPNNTHNDGVQFYGGSGIVARYNRIDIGFNGTNQNGALFFQGDFTGPVIDHNFLSGGGYTLRLEGGVKNAVVTNNTFKLPTGPQVPNWTGTHSIQGTVTTWSGNVLYPNNTPLNK